MKESIIIGVLFSAGIVYAVLVWVTMWLFKWLWIAITKVFDIIDRIFDFILTI